MGTIYYVGCRECKIVRDLSKSHVLNFPVETRKEALDFANKIASDSFHCGLLVSFIGKHMRHNCVLFTDEDSKQRNEFDFNFIDDNLIKRKNEDTDFWEEGDELSKTEEL